MLGSTAVRRMRSASRQATTPSADCFPPTSAVCRNGVRRSYIQKIRGPSRDCPRCSAPRASRRGTAADRQTHAPSSMAGVSLPELSSQTMVPSGRPLRRAGTPAHRHLIGRTPPRHQASSEPSRQQFWGRRLLGIAPHRASSPRFGSAARIATRRSEPAWALRPL